MQYLNLGCGFRYHPAWTNVDFVSTNKDVIAYNLKEGIPFPDASFDAVYHSHLLEHFSRREGENIIRECYRVLRHQGVLRVAVPDLEKIARTYLIALERASSGSREWVDNYEWILLEMYDQTVREYSGGEMKEYLHREQIPNEEFILKRCGVEVRNLIEARRKHGQDEPAEERKIVKKGFFANIRDTLLDPCLRREYRIKRLLGREYGALQIGRFRQGGEVHQWMYDHHSLVLLFKKCGFDDIVRRSANESFIPAWTGFNLDTEPDGSVYKPESIFMEALKRSL